MTGVLPKCYTSVTEVLPKCDNSVTGVLPKCDNIVTGVLPKCDNSVPVLCALRGGRIFLSIRYLQALASESTIPVGVRNKRNFVKQDDIHPFLLSNTPVTLL